MKNLVFNQKSEYPSVFDDAFDFFKPLFGDESNVMRTDIKENKDNYELNIEMPGFTKENILIDLEDGYLNISAKKEEQNEKDSDFTYLKKECISECARSFYVGDIKEDCVKASYVDGILNIILPKLEEEKPQKHNISIE